MSNLVNTLTVVDLLLVVLLTLVAFLGNRRRHEAPADPSLLQQQLVRLRLQFLVLSVAWAGALFSTALVLALNIAAERVEILLLVSQAFLLVLALVYEASLFAAPQPYHRRPEGRDDRPTP